MSRRNCVLFLVFLFTVNPATVLAATLSGRVELGKEPVAGANVSLRTSHGKPDSVRRVKTNAAGEFRFPALPGSTDSEVVYVVSEGGTVKGSAAGKLTLLTVIGNPTPPNILVNEFTTIGSTWPNAQMLNGETLRGSEAGLRIGSQQVANLVDVRTGSYGDTLLNGENLNDSETMAKMNTLASLVSLCGDPETAAGCAAFLSLTQSDDTLVALQKIARRPWQKAVELYGLFEKSFPAESPGGLREGAVRPYLIFPPESFSLQIRFSGGGLLAPGKLAFDDQGNLWTGSNWMPGSQSGVVNNIGGGVAKFAPSGRALSPAVTGFNGQQIEGIGWGTGISRDKVWVGTFNKTIGVFDLAGNALGPVTFAGKTGEFQGVGVARNGDVWIADNTKSQMVWFPQGDIARAQIIQVPGLDSPFGVAIDLQNRVWVSSSEGNQVTVFPAERPGSPQHIKIAMGARGIAIDSKGNAWVSEQSSFKKYPWWYAMVAPKKPTTIMQEFQEGLEYLEKHTSSKDPIGQMALISPNLELVNWQYGEKKGLYVPWGISIDGNDTLWISNFYGQGLVHMCGSDVTRCPEGMKTGDIIHVYQSGLIERPTDSVVDAAGNVWTANNWDNIKALNNSVSPGRISTMGGGQGVVITYGIAKPVRNPLLGPVRTPESEVKKPGSAAK